MTGGFPGNMAILMAGIMALVTGGSFFITALGRKNLASIGRNAYLLQVAFTLAACVNLYYLFFTHDFSIKYVYEYSSLSLPFFYLVSSFWAGQEGTYLLWLLFSSLFGLAILFRGGKYTTWGMSFYSIINIFFCLVLMKMSPFAPLGGVVQDGAGLNPLLQDPWMVIHPPVVFLAFAVAGVPFAIALAAMVRRDFTGWLPMIFPYMILVALGLLAGNAMGGYWAYKTLGWGGYWAWDPVENTSFVPWMIATGLIHSLIIEKRTGALRRTNLLITCLVFFLVVYGTFLTRSGVLADFSVHSFVDLGTNIYLIVFMLFILVLTAVVFLTSRNPAIKGQPMDYNVFGRDFILLIGMIILVIFGFIVLFWSSLPLITGFLMETPAAADVATYNTFAFPFAILISLFLTLSPIIGLAGASIDIKKRLVFAVTISLLHAVFAFLFTSFNMPMIMTLFLYILALVFYTAERLYRKKLLTAIGVGLAGILVSLILGVREPENLLFIGAAVAAMASQIQAIIILFPGQLRLAGGHISHFGIGLMLLGIIGSSAYSKEERIILPLGEDVSAFDYILVYQGMQSSIMTPENELLLSIKDGPEQFEARPRYFYTSRMDGIMKRPYIKSSILYDLYLSPIEIQEQDVSEGLVLKRGESSTIGDFEIKFIDFDMKSHETGGLVSIGANLSVLYKGDTAYVCPVATSDLSSASKKLVSDPIELFPGSGKSIILNQVLPSDGAVVLEIPGLADIIMSEQLIMSVSIKPWINLLWLGIVIVFGGLIVSGTRFFSIARN